MSRRLGFVAWIGLLCLVAVTPAAGQALTTAVQFGSSERDEVWGVASDATGTYLGGVTAGTLPGQTSAGGSDAFIRKVDETGHELWTRQFGTSETDYGFQVAVDSTGVAIIGNTDGVFPGQTKLGDTDAFVRKYDPNGNELWTRQFGTPKGDFGSNIVADATGIYVVGSTLGVFPGATRQGRQDVFLRKYGPTGNELWTVQYGSRADDFGYANAVDAGGVTVVGFTSGSLAGNARGRYDAFVSRFDLDGNELWTKQFGTKGMDLGYGIATDPTAVYVSGVTDGRFKDQTRRGATDAFVRKFSADDGHVEWTSQFGTPRPDQSLAVALDAGTVYVVGITDGQFKGQPSAGKTDAFARAFDEDGVPMWTLQFGTARRDSADWAIVDGGTLSTVGMTMGEFTGQMKSGKGDGFLVQIGLP